MPQFGTAALRVGGSAGSPSTVSNLNRNPAILTPSFRLEPDGLLSLVVDAVGESVGGTPWSCSR
jgi:hypothetical protein